jgi:hypothetical protein
MRFMNEYDIESARSRHTRNSHPNRLAAAIVIDRLREWADENSDGWAYWPKPARAAANLMEIADFSASRVTDEDVTDAELALAVRPVKAFLTRQAREKDRFGNSRVTAEQRELILRASQPLFEVL